MKGAARKTNKTIIIPSLWWILLILLFFVLQCISNFLILNTKVEHEILYDNVNTKVEDEILYDNVVFLFVD